MRIISQDGMIDMPYEQVIVSINYQAKDRIVAVGVSLQSEPIVMAEYSDEFKSVKAMEKLRDRYRSHKSAGYQVYFIFPKDEEL